MSRLGQQGARGPGRPRPPTEVLYARAPADLVEWVRQQAERSGLSMAAATVTMLAYCREAGLTLEKPRPAGLLVAGDTARLDLHAGR